MMNQQQIRNKLQVTYEGHDVVISFRGDVRTYLETYSQGYVFNPSDRILLRSYLKNKIDGKPLPLNDIHDVNISDHDPESLARKIFFSIYLLIFIM